MNAKEFYKEKTSHELNDDCGVRLTGKELFELMEEYHAQFESQPEQPREQEKVITYCGNPITTEDDCAVLAKKKTCIGCKYVIIDEQPREQE